MRKIGRRPQLSALRPTRIAIGSHALGGDHAERHHRRRLFRELQSKLLPHQGEERRVGEVKEKGASGEDHQRARAKEDAISGHANAVVSAVSSKISRPIVIDRLRGDHQHCGGGQSGEEGHEQKDDALGEEISDASREKRDRDVAAVVEGRIAAEPAR
jgi:hypothetical protein